MLPRKSSHRLSQNPPIGEVKPDSGTDDSLGSVCKVRTQDPENLDEEVKSLVTAWRGLLEKPMKPPAVQRLGNRPLHLQVLAMGRIRIRIRVDVEKGRPGTRN